jgi:hypothetical protein
MNRNLPWLAAALLLGSAACASVQASRARHEALQAELDALRYDRPIDESWPEVRKLLAERKYPMTGEDARAVGQKEELLDFLSPSRETRDSRSGVRSLQTGWGPGNQRYRAEAIPDGDRWRVALTAIVRENPSDVYRETSRRDLDLELELARRLDPEAAKRIEDALGAPGSTAR